MSTNEVLERGEAAGRTLGSVAIGTGWAAPDEPVETWAWRMRAVAMGWAQNEDDRQDICLACVQIADEALARQNASNGTTSMFTWRETIDRLWGNFLSHTCLIRNQGETFFADMEEQFVKCGEVADWWLAQQAAAAN